MEGTFGHNRIISALLIASFLLAGIGGVSAQRTEKGNAGGQDGLSRGQEALARFGSKLPEVAQRNGKTPEQLKAILESDSSSWLNSAGDLLFVDEAVIQESASAAVTDGPVAQAALFPYSETFFLNSRPGSRRTIYLDFDGHTTSGTQWNGDFTKWQDIVSAPFSFDGDPSTFSQAEQDVIQAVWQRVAEDYAPFDVNVTTQYPGEGALTLMSTGDTLYGMRVVISPTNFTGRSLGGIAYFGKFNFVLNEGYQPVFVMSDYLCGTYSDLQRCGKVLADTVSHEVGHTLSLNHDGFKNPDGTVSEYYGGQGNWAPLMGVPFGRDVTQWSKGEYATANNLEDDIAIIQANGVSLRADDHSNTTRGATYIGSNAVNAKGIISSSTDVDYFTFTTGAGAATLNINPSSEGPNLKLRAQLLNSSKVVIATFDQVGLSASISTTLAAGTYFLMVDGVGDGDPVTLGYSDYGSLGGYTVTGSLVPTGPQAPTARVTSDRVSGTAPLTVNFYGSSSSDPDGSISRYLWDFGDGTTSTAANPAKTFQIGARYPVKLTVVDNQGLVGSMDYPIDALVNRPPIAAVSASATTGLAPLTLNFSSAGSNDPEGGPLTYFWRFNSSSTSTLPNPSFTFADPGPYRVTLTVTDNLGLASAQAYVDLSVTSYVYIQSATTSKSTTTKGTSAKITLTVVSADGKPRQSATVTGAWSGAASGEQSGLTNSKGQITFTSPLSPTKGSFIFTVNNIALNYLYPYDSTKNVGGGTQSFVIP